MAEVVRYTYCFIVLIPIFQMGIIEDELEEISESYEPARTKKEDDYRPSKVNKSVPFLRKARNDFNHPEANRQEYDEAHHFTPTRRRIAKTSQLDPAYQANVNDDFEDRHYGENDIRHLKPRLPDKHKSSRCNFGAFVKAVVACIGLIALAANVFTYIRAPNAPPILPEMASNALNKVGEDVIGHFSLPNKKNSDKTTRIKIISSKEKVSVRLVSKVEICKKKFLKKCNFLDQSKHFGVSRFGS